MGRGEGQRRYGGTWRDARRSRNSIKHGAREQRLAPGWNNLHVGVNASNNFSKKLPTGRYGFRGSGKLLCGDPYFAP